MSSSSDPLTSLDCELVCSSWDRIMPAFSRFSELFYERLLGAHPELSSMFAVDIESQSRMLKNMFSGLIFLARAGDLPRCRRRLQGVFYSHSSRGILPEHYTWFGDCLLSSLRDQGLSISEQSAWRRFYSWCIHQA
jgi:hemoglobin-like flavoprotein